MQSTWRAIALALACIAAIQTAAAQQAPMNEPRDFPNRALRIVVPFPAGGPADIVARVIGQRMSEDWGRVARVVEHLFRTVRPRW